MPIEERWLEDLRQYNGQYDQKLLGQLSGSKLFVNITRPKTNTAEARLSDTLLPTDEANWDIRPTPIPETDEKQVIGEDEQGHPVTQADKDNQIAKAACEKMRQRISDQLSEAKYNAKTRDVIHHACVLGTGILKGPVVIGKVERKWQQIKDEDGQTASVLSEIVKKQPSVEVVDPWNYFPDMAATSIEDCEFEIERHYFTKKQLRKLASRPGYIREQIGKVLETEPSHAPESYLTSLRTMSGVTTDPKDKRYRGWEYHGPVSKEDLISCGCEIDEDDQFTDYEGVLVVVNGVVVKAIINPMDTDDRPYSVFSYEKDDTCVFGFGVPRLTRNAQKVVNASWRMWMDNSGLSTGPQYVINTKFVEPIAVNGEKSWKMTGRKGWQLKDPTKSVRDVFGLFEIPSHQAELMATFQAARALADDESGVPVIAQGEQGEHTTQTAQGMSLLMNASNVVLKRAVKNFDDDLTVPVIGRFYDWNMQFTDDNDIKGDFEIDARGASSLLIKETQARNAVTLSQIAGSNELFAKATKWLALYRKVVKGMQFEHEEIVMSDDEFKSEMDQGGGKQDPRVVAAQLRAQTEQEKLKQAWELGVAELRNTRELGFARLALEKQLTIEQLYTKLNLEHGKLGQKGLEHDLKVYQENNRQAENMNRERQQALDLHEMGMKEAGIGGI